MRAVPSLEFTTVLETEPDEPPLGHLEIVRGIVVEVFRKR